ncbi:MAG: hypothetical protein PHW63_08145 [Alphaproteobacteria bacterium]|nr:hypothetical protein [Alphaproteobacteria bacterium]
MTDKILYWVTTISSGLALILLIINLTMISGNQSIQGDINQKQMVINTAQTVAVLNKQLSEALYSASVKNNDESLRELLTTQGFTLPTVADKQGASKVAQDTQETKKPAAVNAKKTSKSSEEE